MWSRSITPAIHRRATNTKLASSITALANRRPVIIALSSEDSTNTEIRSPGADLSTSWLCGLEISSLSLSPQAMVAQGQSSISRSDRPLQGGARIKVIHTIHEEMVQIQTARYPHSTGFLPYGTSFTYYSWQRAAVSEFQIVITQPKYHRLQALETFQKIRIVSKSVDMTMKHG